MLGFDVDCVDIVKHINYFILKMKNNCDALSVTGKGIYPISMVAKLVDLSARSIHSWVRSYEKYEPMNGCRRRMWKPQLLYLDGQKYLTFRDLLELRVISIFKKYNIHYRILVALSEVVSAYYATDYPFVTSRFSTDGKNIYVKDNRSYNKITNVYNKNILLPEVERCIEKEVITIENNEIKVAAKTTKNKIFRAVDEFDYVVEKEIRFKEQRPVEWCVDPERYSFVCLNPDFYAGYPTVGYMPTSRIYKDSQSGQSIDSIAAEYELNAEMVKQAIHFESEYLN